MGTTYQDLLDELIHARDAHYRDDVQREDAIKEMMLSVMQSMLELLRDGRGKTP